ncbi:MAG: tRNA glutamyl-Q(34) synthetase GluQRS [Acidiferrobacterales bacterium]
MTNEAPRGRFAPSPTGPLHFGSLVAAVGSYLNVKSRGGQWLVRIEDLDPPREEPGAAGSILKTLETYNLLWDEPVIYQSQRSEVYEAAIEQLSEQGLTYYCQCSRKDIAADAGPGIDGLRYPGTCRNLNLGPGNRSLRVKVPDQVFVFEDAIQGSRQQNLERDLGDFVIRRRDGLYSYQLAVVVDDGIQDITEVCRGTDLIDSTPRQIYLQQVLGLPTPKYLHLPVAMNQHGQKLSKQTLAAPVPQKAGSHVLSNAIRFLGQNLPTELVGAPTAELIEWGVEYWDLSTVPRTLAIRV